MSVQGIASRTSKVYASGTARRAQKADRHEVGCPAPPPPPPSDEVSIPHFRIENVISMDIATRIGCPSLRAGLNRHCCAAFIASSSNPCRWSRDRTTTGGPIVPSGSTMASSSTIPWIFSNTKTHRPAPADQLDRTQSLLTRVGGSSPARVVLKRSQMLS
jgi:hypothetical protein